MAKLSINDKVKVKNKNFYMRGKKYDFKKLLFKSYLKYWGGELSRQWWYRCSATDALK